MVREDIRRVTKEVGKELGQAFISGKRFLKKRVRVPPRNGAPLAFAVVPPQYYRPIQKPRPVRRRIKRRR